MAERVQIHKIDKQETQSTGTLILQDCVEGSSLGAKGEALSTVRMKACWDPGIHGLCNGFNNQPLDHSRKKTRFHSLCGEVALSERSELEGRNGGAERTAGTRRES